MPIIRGHPSPDEGPTVDKPPRKPPPPPPPPKKPAPPSQRKMMDDEEEPMAMKSGGKVSASKRADGIAQRGKTKGTIVMCKGGMYK